MDRTGTDSLAYALAFAHPAYMLLTLALAMLTLRRGLRLRSARRRGLCRSADDYHAHLRLARWTLGLIVPGYVLGLASAFFLRGMSPFGTAHAAAATSALVLFLATGWLGRGLARGELARRELHAALALLAVLAAAAAFATGFVLLP